MNAVCKKRIRLGERSSIRRASEHHRFEERKREREGWGSGGMPLQGGNIQNPKSSNRAGKGGENREDDQTRRRKWPHLNNGKVLCLLLKQKKGQKEDAGEWGRRLKEKPRCIIEEGRKPVLVLVE